MKNSTARDHETTWQASDVIDEWYTVQRAWMYLENIFSAEAEQRYSTALSRR